MKCDCSCDIVPYKHDHITSWPYIIVRLGNFVGQREVNKVQNSVPQVGKGELGAK